MRDGEQGQENLIRPLAACPRRAEGSCRLQHFSVRVWVTVQVSLQMAHYGNLRPQLERDASNGLQRAQCRGRSAGAMRGARRRLRHGGGLNEQELEQPEALAEKTPVPVVSMIADTARSSAAHAAQARSRSPAQISRDRLMRARSADSSARRASRRAGTTGTRPSWSCDSSSLSRAGAAESVAAFAVRYSDLTRLTCSASS